MIKLGRRPDESSGGMSDPRRLDGPEPGANDPLRSGSRITSILGASGAGALISGTFASFLFKSKEEGEGNQFNFFCFIDIYVASQRWLTFSIQCNEFKKMSHPLM